MPPTDWVSMAISANVMAQAQPSKTKATQAQASSVGNDNTDATQAAFRNALDYLSTTLFSHLRQNVSVEDAIDIMLDDAQWQALRQQFELLHSKQANSPWTESLVKRFPWATHPVVSPPVRKAAEHCIELLQATRDANNALTAAHVRLPHSVDQTFEDELWFLADPAVPAALRRGLLAHRRAMIALLATQPPSHSGTLISTSDFKQVRSLIDACNGWLTDYLRVLANMPEANVTQVAASQENVAETANNDDVFVAALARRDVGGSPSQT